jgi:AcrR family transcriptional regulator
MPEPAADAAPTRREAIIRAATDLFAEQGYHAVGMRAIADAVGIRGSSLYHHFASKIDLLYAISLDSTGAFIASQLPVLEAGGPPAERLERLLRDHVRYFHEHRREEAVGLRELEILRLHAPEHHADVQEKRRAYQHAIQAVIEEGERSGAFSVEDPQLATLALLGLVNSVNDWFRDDGPRTIDDVADAYARMGVGRLLGAGARERDALPADPR